MKSFDSATPWRRFVVRLPQFETCESRVALAADSVGELHLDYRVDARTIADLGASLPTNLGVHDLTGVTTVRANYGLNGYGQTVVVIDSGVAYDHAALGGGLGAGKRVVGGWDFTGENDANPYDDGPMGSHGTHVAGIIASSDPTALGVASGVDLVALRVFDDTGAGNFSWVERALQWVHAHRNDYRFPVTTINLSIGTTWNAASIPAWTTLENEFAQLAADGIFIAVAAGNSFADYNTPGLSYPAASSHVVAVGSVDGSGTISSFSQRLQRALFAPGRTIRSTVPDYAGNFNNRTDDFANYSGTSMAAPYLAGAAVLVRQAFGFVGQYNVNQTTIYDLLRRTADDVYDPATQQSYKRLNLARAIDAVMPTDEDGSTAATSRRLGTLSGDANFAGILSRLNDRDYFTFTAGVSGTATFTVSANNGTAVWEIVGGAGVVAGSKFTVSVVAGQTYTVGLAGNALARYQIQTNVKASVVVTDWGTLDFAEFRDQRIAGEAYYTVTAGRSGLLSLEALFAHAAGNVDVEIYNAQNQLVVASRTLTGVERIDVRANAGEKFLVRIVGANQDVDLRVANLVAQSGTTVEVHGTAGNDAFTATAGATHVVVVNGFTYRFNATQVTRIAFHGGSGYDVATIVGTAANDTLTASIDAARLVSKTYELVATAEYVYVGGGGGGDVATLFDSAGDDELVLDGATARLTSATYALRVAGFGTIVANAPHGGVDVATLQDSAGNDTLVASPGSTRWSSNSFVHVVNGFGVVRVYATRGGYDTATLNGSAGDDAFTADPAFSRLVGAGYEHYVAGFDAVYAESRGGNDTAAFFDSAGADDFLRRTDRSRMTGTGYLNQANNFRNVRAVSQRGGKDTATIQDTAGDDLIRARANWFQMHGANQTSEVTGFASVVARISTGITTSDVQAIDFVYTQVNGT